MSNDSKIKVSSWLFSMALIAIILFLQQCNTNAALKQEVDIQKKEANRQLSNYIAAEQTIERFINENGELVSKVRSYEFDITRLNKDNMQLISKYNSVLTENKKLKGVNNLLSAEIEIRDSILANISVLPININDSELTFQQENDYGDGNTRTISGRLSVSIKDGRLESSPIEIISLSKLSLLAAIKEDKGVKYLEIATSYPGVKINKIENISLVNRELNRKIEKRAGWSIGFGVTYGVNLNNNQIINYGPAMGVGVYWSPKWLRF